MKPHSAPAERNRDPILAVLRQYFGDRRHVLEIGSGTGQHAVHFATALPGLQWQASDHADALPGLAAWREDAALPNLPAPVELQAVPGAGLRPLPALPRSADGTIGFDAVFTANTLHIMGWPQVRALFAALPDITTPDALLVVYGPFKVEGHYTSESNRVFDAWLADHFPEGGQRDIEAVQALAREAGFRELAAFAMPANNQCRVWRRGKSRFSEPAAA